MSTDRRLRDLSEDAFRATYHADRFTASVLLNRMRYTVEHMSAAFLREAFSPIIRDWYDFACTISGPAELDYPMVAVSNSLTPFLGRWPTRPATASWSSGRSTCRRVTC